MIEPSEPTAASSRVPIPWPLNSLGTWTDSSRGSARARQTSARSQQLCRAGCHEKESVWLCRVVAQVLEPLRLIHERAKNVWIDELRV